ncbi:hypothetical protein BH23ACT10_BH23ACT10_39600 [soil metagenome]
MTAEAAVDRREDGVVTSPDGPVSVPPPPRSARAFAALTVVGVLLGASVIAADIVLGVPPVEMLRRYTLANAAIAWTFTPVAGLILSRHSRHRVGWIMLWIGLLAPAQILSSQLADLFTPPGLPYADWPPYAQVFSWIPIWVWVPAVLPMVTLLPLYFPDGRLPSARWRIVAVAAYVVIATIALGFAAGYWPWAGTAPPPLRPDDDLTALGGLIDLGFALLPPVVMLAVASVVVRYRRAASVARHQVRWLLFGVALAAPLMTTALVAQQVVGEPRWVFVMIAASVVPIPLTVGIAILRHRLFDIDVVISRSLTAAGLALFISGIYVAVVVGVGSVLGVRDGPDLWLQVAATAIVAVAFQPVRRWLRGRTDRLVFGHRTTPYEVLANFSRTASQTATSDTLPAIAQLLADGTGAQPATVWLRVGATLRLCATAVAGARTAVAVDTPPGAHEDTAVGSLVPLGSGGTLPDVPGDAVTAVVHDGRVLGALSVHKPRGEQVGDQDRDLLDRLAGGVALLRNAALTEELKVRLDELIASRQRLVHADDDARRRLERDLREGPQRHLAPVRAEVAAARGLAHALDASRSAAILDQVADDIDAADATLGDLAHGIYPPLLEAEGLQSALEEQARRAALPVSVHAAGLGRFGRDIEACAYFCVLEALQNVAKYADASSAHVRLSVDGAALRFVVSDDGREFDPATTADGSGLRGMADRLDTIDGRLSMRSAPGRGTTVTGLIPGACGETNGGSQQLDPREHERVRS